MIQSPNGGWLDGCLGVVAGLEILRSLAERYDGTPPCTVRLVDWADEEGARFGRSLFGSSAFAGTHTIEADRVRVDKDGSTLEETLRSCDVEVDRIGEAGNEKQNMAAYLELHIEQGPFLSDWASRWDQSPGPRSGEMGRALSGTGGAFGLDSHGCAAGCAGGCGEAGIGDTADIAPISTVGRDSWGVVKTFPGIVTAVVGRCETTLDLRDLDAHVLAGMLREAKEASERFAAEERCTVERSKIWSIGADSFPS